MVTVKVPATSANIGCGFDCMGVAFQYYNTVKVGEIECGLKIDITDDTKTFLPRDERSLVYRAMMATFDEVGYNPKGIHIIQDNKIPVTRGMGSSGASIVSGVLAADYIAKSGLTKTEMVEISSRIEGHPDNVAAAIYGGMTLVVEDRDKLICNKIPINANKLVFAVFVPDFILRTKVSRGVLPDTIPHSDGVFNLSRSALLTYAMMSENYELLKTALQDRLHHPYRRGLIRGLEKIFCKSEECGGLGSYISGAGPVIVTPLYAADAPEFRKTMGSYLKKNLQSWGLMILKPDNLGARIIKEDENIESDS